MRESTGWKNKPQEESVNVDLSHFSLLTLRFITAGNLEWRRRQRTFAVVCWNFGESNTHNDYQRTHFEYNIIKT